MTAFTLGSSDRTSYDAVDASDGLAEYPAGADRAEHAETAETIGCIVPAVNAGATIAAVLESLLAQSRLPDAVHVVAHDSTDSTVAVASRYAGPHTRTVDGVEQSTEVYVHDLGAVDGGRVAALNYGFSLVEACDYLLEVDVDTAAAPSAVADLLDEITADSRVAGVSAILDVDAVPHSGAVASFLVAGQRAQAAATQALNRLRGGNVAVLDGRFTLLSTAALRRTMADNHQSTPWVADSELESSLLSLQLASAGFQTKVSARARAAVSAMTTLRALDAQQVRWNLGAIELMWPGQHGGSTGRPLHRSLRLSWRANVSLAVSAVVRIVFVALLLGSVSLGTPLLGTPGLGWLAVHPLYLLWLTPFLIATLLRVRHAVSLGNAGLRDILFAATLLPAELYLWVRIGHFVRAWSAFLGRRPDGDQEPQERAGGRARIGYWLPVLALPALGVVVLAVWLQLDTLTQSVVLWVGWPVLAVVVGVRTISMTVALLRRNAR